MYRSRHTEKQYGKDKLAIKSDKCPLCHLDDRHVNPRERRIIATTEHCLVIDAMYHYSVWDGFAVTEHLMIIPKRHVSTLNSLSAPEKIEILDLIQAYEDKGYDVYLRGKASAGRTVPMHQHTHLIKTHGKRAKALFYLHKPYMLHKF